MNIYYLGPDGTFSHILAAEAFQENLHSLIPARSFDEIFKHVTEEDDSVGVIPVENSITSNVHENIDRLFRGDLRIIGEAFLEISLHLLGSKGASASEITTILSHPKALEQCSRFLSSYRGEIQESSSTAQSAESLSKETALIGSKSLAKVSGLEVLKENVGDISQNSTRFVFIAQSDLARNEKEDCDRLTFTFQVRHEPGALVKVLSSLESAQANLTKIESRPIPGRDWEYLFWVDLEIAAGQSDEICKIVKDNTLEYHVLGFYTAGRVYSS